jgi:hypothetical protein
MHQYDLREIMVCNSSNNPSGVPRYLSNGNVRLMKPMKFNREGGLAAQTIVERTTLRALGVESFHFPVDESSREGIAPYNKLGNGLWPVMPPPERNEEEQALHKKAGDAEKTRLMVKTEQESTVAAQGASMVSSGAKI